ncbi:MAG: pilus assembly protein PilP [Gammaproteobacteria bacterium]|jgi:type IV pilus assembly protein PilP
MNHYPRSRWRLLAILAALTLPFAAGCGGDMDDLDAYIDRTKAQPGRRPDPLPEIKPYETYVYTADVDGLRSPFVPDSPVADTRSGGEGGGIRPDVNRSREYLEQFPLDSLDMVGTLTQGNTTYGLIQTTDGLISRVSVGNYVGQNDGRINEINESEICLKEIISDGIGGYLERDACVSISD